MRLCATVFFAFTAACSAHAAEVVDYQGTPLGATMAAFLSNHPWFKCRAIPPDLRVAGDFSCNWNVRANEPPINFGGAPASSVRARFIGDRFGALDVTYNSTGFGTLADAMKVKFGTPTTVENVDFATQGGLRTTNDVLVWRLGGAVVVLKRFGHSITEGSVAYQAEWMRDEMEARTGPAARENAKTL